MNKSGSGVDELQWSCEMCTMINNLNNTQCITCGGTRPQTQYATLLEIKQQFEKQHMKQLQIEKNSKKKPEPNDVDDDDDLAEYGLDYFDEDDDDNKNEEIRVRLLDEIFSLNTGIIKLSPFLSKFHNGDMQKFVESEIFLYDIIPKTFDINIPKEVCTIITEYHVGEIPEIPRKIEINTFNKIIKYLQYHYKIKEVSSFAIPLLDRHNMNEIIDDEFDIDLVDKCNESELSNLGLSALYLDIEPLNLLVCAKMALLYRGNNRTVVANKLEGIWSKVQIISPNDWWL